MNKETAQSIIDKLEDNPLCGSCGVSEDLVCYNCKSTYQKGVMLGDVLEKFKNEIRFVKLDISYNNILSLWMDCGFDKSLNQIIEEWSPETEELFNFLNQIFDGE